MPLEFAFTETVAISTARRISQRLRWFFPFNMSVPPSSISDPDIHPANGPAAQSQVSLPLHFQVKNLQHLKA